MKKIKKTLLAGILLLFIAVTVAFKTDYFEVAKQLEIYTTLFKELNMYYIDEINPGKLTDTAIRSMLNDLDPYTRFYDEQGVEDAKINSSGEYSGVGATTKYLRDKLTIVDMIKGMPAEKAGLKIGDEIVKVDNVAVNKDNRQEIFTLLKGAEESVVDLQILRRGKTMNFKVKREKIDMNPVPHYQMIDDEVGYISFIKFNTKASAAVKHAFEDLKSQGMKKLILDLRNNPGGLLNEAIDITNFFIPKGEVVVTTRAKLKKWSETYRTKNEPLDLEIPLVVLVNNHSASASEIVSGSLQDLDRAVIVGERSFGKGLVQRFRNLPYGTKLKLTISKYYTPSGRNIQELDYTHRHGNNIPKYSDKEREKFQTRNGRIVYGGGGIEPDVKVDRKELNNATKALFESDLIFRFTTDYYYAHPEIAPAKDFSVSEQDFTDFITYIRKNSDAFQTRTEKIFESGLEEAEKEHLKNNISGDYEDLKNAITDKKIEDILDNKDRVMEQLNDAILNRYYFKKGEYVNHIYHNSFILEALKTIKDEDRYKKLLQ